MTIITKSNLSDKKTTEEDVLVHSESLPSIDEDKLDLEACPKVIQAKRPKRIVNSITLCIFFVSLLVVVIGIVGCIRFYQQLSKERIYHSSVDLPIDELIHETGSANSHENLPSGHYQRQGKSRTHRKPIYINEQFHIDLDNDDYERITITQTPHSLNIRPAHFIHVFSMNKTGIVDIKGRRCFIMPLDRNRIMAPHILFEIMVKLKANYYKLDSRIIHQALRIMQPPINDYQSLGYYIARECVGFVTYRVERMTRPVFKREAKEKNSNEDLSFFEYAGSMMKYSIVNANEF